MSRVPAGMAATVLTAVGTACIAAPLLPRPETAGTVAGRSPTGRAAELLVPPGNGTLRQDDITLTLEADDLQLKVTPLEEWVVRLTAPDTWSRLSALARAHRTEVERRTGRPGALFLVSFFSRVPGVSFRPDEVQLVNRGRRQRAVLIRPITAGWGTERLQPEETQLAVYAFPDEVDVEQPLTLEYRFETASGWDEILRRLETELGRARARAGLGR